MEGLLQNLVNYFATVPFPFPVTEQGAVRIHIFISARTAAHRFRKDEGKTVYGKKLGNNNLIEKGG